jgi:hypothetical protein
MNMTIRVEEAIFNFLLPCYSWRFWHCAKRKEGMIKMGRAKAKKIFQPEFFQGNLNKKTYFEGWYFKQVASMPDQTISFIPGISLNETDKHAFIQVIISPAMETHYFKFHIDEFKASDSEFEIKIGPNTFSTKGITIALKNEDQTIFGNVRFSSFQPIQKSLWMPNIMGPFGYLTVMECNHGVVSMSHEVSGTLYINETKISFNNTRGYLEKDWGISFPKSYIWLQCNDFDQKDVSFMFSIANVPFMGKDLQGFICNLVYQGREVRLATYTSAKMIKLEVNDHQLTIVIKSKKQQLTIIAESKAYGELKAPKAGVMQHIIKEGIEGKIMLRLINNKGEQILKTHGAHAGIEIEY